MSKNSSLQLIYAKNFYKAEKLRLLNEQTSLLFDIKLQLQELIELQKSQPKRHRTRERNTSAI